MSDARPAGAAIEPGRIEGAFKAAPGDRRVMMAMMEACAQAATSDELDEVAAPILASNRSVRGTVELRRLLEEHGAIEYLPSDDEVAARSGDDEPEIDDEGFYVVNTPVPGQWALTEEGKAYLDADPLGAYARELLEGKDAHLAPVYTELLHLLVSGPATKAEVDKVAESNPLTQEPRMYGGHFIAELERAGAAAWDDAWTITEFGRDLLAKLEGEA